MKPTLQEQSILAVYFNKEGEVDRLANYKLEDGRVVVLPAMLSLYTRLRGRRRPSPAPAPRRDPAAVG